MIRTFLAATLAALLASPTMAQTPAARPAPPTSRPAPAMAPPAAPQAAPPAVATAAATGGKIDVNSATEQQLDSLPGVGPARAKAIVAHRPYADLNDLVKKKAIPANVLAGDKDRLALANINTSTAADLAKALPGIGEVRSKQIVDGRPYATPQDLVTKKVLTQPALDKIKDLVAY